MKGVMRFAFQHRLLCIPRDNQKTNDIAKEAKNEKIDAVMKTNKDTKQTKTQKK